MISNHTTGLILLLLSSTSLGMLLNPSVPGKFKGTQWMVKDRQGNGEPSVGTILYSSGHNYLYVVAIALPERPMDQYYATFPTQHLSGPFYIKKRYKDASKFKNVDLNQAFFYPVPAGIPAKMPKPHVGYIIYALEHLPGSVLKRRNSTPLDEHQTRFVLVLNCLWTDPATKVHRQTCEVAELWDGRPPLDKNHICINEKYYTYAWFLPEELVGLAIDDPEDLHETRMPHDVQEILDALVGEPFCDASIA